MVGIRHILATPFHPQSNGKLERYHQTIKGDVNQVPYEAPSDLQEAIAAFVSYYNHRRYHMSLGNVRLRPSSGEGATTAPSGSSLATLHNHYLLGSHSVPLSLIDNSDRPREITRVGDIETDVGQMFSDLERLTTTFT